MEALISRDFLASQDVRKWTEKEGSDVGHKNYGMFFQGVQDVRFKRLTAIFRAAPKSPGVSKVVTDIYYLLSLRSHRSHLVVVCICLIAMKHLVKYGISNMRKNLSRIELIFGTVLLLSSSDNGRSERPETLLIFFTIKNLDASALSFCKTAIRSPNA